MKHRMAVRLVFYVIALAALIAGTAVMPGGSLLLPATALADSDVCAVPGADGPAVNLGGIINTYYPGTASVSAGATSIPVGIPRGAAERIAAGDLLLVIQMQDADILPVNDERYGDGVGTAGSVTGVGSGVLDLGNSGRYEYVVATGPVAGGTVPIFGANNGGLVYDYARATFSAASGQRTFQVIRVPQYSSVILDPANPLITPPWEGSVGGVLVFDVAGELDLNGATMDVNGHGFRGGGVTAARGVFDPSGFAATDYVTLAIEGANGSKGEGIAGTPRFVYQPPARDGSVIDTGVEGYPNGSYARGAPGNAGGGGTGGQPSTNQENSGGGGGGNVGTGGRGGNSWFSNLEVGGFGGVGYSADPERLLAGGGAGSGTSNDATGMLPNGQSSSGAGGGGIAIVRAGTTTGVGTVEANGGDAMDVDNDGAGGGGAGGTVVFVTSAGSLAGLTVEARGGNGGNVWLNPPPNIVDFIEHGPGGGGGGGVVFISDLAATVDVGGGQNGVTSPSRVAYGARPGSPGEVVGITPDDLPTVIGGEPCLPELSVVKTTSTPLVQNTPNGTTAVYTIEFSNAPGDGTALDVTVGDPLPAGFTYRSTTAVNLSGGAVRVQDQNPTPGATEPVWGRFNMPGGAVVEITFEVDIDASVPAGSYPNTATVSYLDPTRTTPDGRTQVTSPPAIVELVQVAADVAIVKSHVDEFTVGQNGVYNLLVSNNGPDAADGPIEVNDTLPRGLTFEGATGENWACTNSGQDVSCSHPGPIAANAELPLLQLTVRVGESAALLSPLINTATVTSPTPDPNPDNNTSTDQVTVLEPLLIVTKRDALVIDQNANGQVNPGDTIEYTIVIVNDGSGDATDLVLSDTPDPDTTLVVGSVQVEPAGPVVTSGNASGDTTVTVQIGTLPAGNVVTVRFRVVINAPFPEDRTEVANQGLVTGGNVPDRPSDDPDTPEPDDPTRTPVIDTGDSPPTAVTVTLFTATATDDGVLLQWVTSWEDNSAGFDIYRGTTRNFADAERVNATIIPARGRGAVETQYQFLDPGAGNGTGYYYWLRENDRDGTTTEYGPAIVPESGLNADHRLLLPVIFR